ncbi:MAG TPA: SRPBCC domain-containing protein [Rhizomicrobium sp.]|jgi:uncharacterized protein YndB with AHSA1/START domain|nr:SRPBCC domain-containing protein [Rhizomicrobium sp.]
MARIVQIAAGLAVALLLSYPACAAVDGVGNGGFALSETVHVAAPPATVYDAFVTPSHWWSAVHSYSHDAANFTMEPRAGGCWCEKLPDGGSVQHMTVVAVMPGKMIRLTGALGPFQEWGVSAALTVTFKPAADGGTDLVATYNMGGYSKSGFVGGAAAADRVLGDNFLRLKAFVETGSPEKT